jgi:hypothetical protein
MWVHTKKTPVPHMYIVTNVSKLGVPERTIKASIQTLIRKGYIRRPVRLSKCASYIQLRTMQAD